MVTMSDGAQDNAGRFVAEFLRDAELPTTEDGDCPYLPGQLARSEGFYVDEPIDGAVYRALMDCGFRRSGRVFYRPVCRNCSACTALRVPTRTFEPTRSMRRVWKRNADVHVEIGVAESTDEKHALYVRYLQDQHDGTMSTKRTAFDDFLYRAPVPAVEMHISTPPSGIPRRAALLGEPSRYALPARFLTAIAPP